MNPLFGNDHHQFGPSFCEKRFNDDPNELNQKDKNYVSKSFNQNGPYYHKNSLSYDEAIKINNINIQNYKNNTTIISYSEEEVYDTNIISYDKLIDILQIKSPYNSENFFLFKHKNYIVNDNVSFNSNFQSGNCRYAIKHNDNEYDIITRPETNSMRNYQWFYFGIKLSNPSSQTIKFNIINLCKKSILFNDSVGVLCYYDHCWSRETFNIHYYPNTLPQINSESSFYTLTFSFDLSSLNNTNTVYFAYSYPYTNTHLSKFLFTLSSLYSTILRFENIGKSANGTTINMLVITNFTDSFEVLARKQAVILTGRVHPGETTSSYVIQGAIEFLLSRSPVAEKLRSRFIFKIIPMLNPDGVEIGNFRYNMHGYDLNRMWVDASPSTSPEIYYTKQMVIKTLGSRDIYLFCDFHGHSSKSNFFMYSCKTNIGSNTIIPQTMTMNSKTSFTEMVFLYLFNKENFIFDKSSCINKISPAKIKTARAVMKNEFGVDFSYCLESSMASIKLSNGSIVPFTIELYKNIGKDFCIIISKMINSKIYYGALNFVRNEKKEKKKSKENLKKPSFNVKELLPFIHSSLYGPSPRINTIGTKKNVSLNKSGSRNNIYNNSKLGGNGYYNYKKNDKNFFPFARINNE